MDLASLQTNDVVKDLYEREFSFRVYGTTGKLWGRYAGIKTIAVFLVVVKRLSGVYA